MKKRGLLLCLCLLLFVGSANALSKTNIREIQNKLLSLGYEIGKADGLIGTKTTAALTIVQELLNSAGHSVPADGTPDQKTITLLMDDENQFLLSTLTLHSSGARVKTIQERMIALGWLHSPADGIYGPETRNAVIRFEEWASAQRIEGILPDGNLNPDEYDLLNSNLSSYGLYTPQDYNENEPLILNEGNLYATAAILLEAVSGEILFEKNADLRLEPASTTKIITLLTALNHNNLDKNITIPKSAANVPADSSLVPVKPGEEMTMRDLLYGLIIRSGNDAANAVAELCSGTVSDFVNEMNELAQSIGMQNSHFVNPHGYHDEDHYTTARDLSIAARYGLTNPDFCKIVTCLNYTLPATKQRKALDIAITHEIFDPNSEYWIPYAAGIKSGYTSFAGFCYVGAYQRDDLTLIAVVMNDVDRSNSWQDLKKLFAYGAAYEAEP